MKYILVSNAVSLNVQGISFKRVKEVIKTGMNVANDFHGENGD